jgi:hypothetical protein
MIIEDSKKVIIIDIRKTKNKLIIQILFGEKRRQLLGPEWREETDNWADFKTLIINR